MATNAPQDDWHKTGLRLPKELHHRLHEAAAESGRSYNAEIVSRLESTFSVRIPQDQFVIDRGAEGAIAGAAVGGAISSEVIKELAKRIAEEFAEVAPWPQEVRERFEQQRQNAAKRQPKK